MTSFKEIVANEASYLHSLIRNDDHFIAWCKERDELESQTLLALEKLSNDEIKELITTLRFPEDAIDDGSLLVNLFDICSFCEKPRSHTGPLFRHNTVDDKYVTICLRCAENAHEMLEQNRKRLCEKK